MTHRANIVVAPTAQIVGRGSPQSQRLFYVIAACAMLILTVVGFREFYLHGKGFGGIAITRQIILLIFLHGFWTTGWVIFFFIQGTLILMGKRRVHTAIGLIGAVLALIIVIQGTLLAALSAYFNPQLYKDFGGPRYFLVIMISQVLMFGTLVVVGLGSRLEIHHPMMLLATVVMMSATLSRFPYTAQLARVPPLYAHGPMLLFGALLFLLHWGMTRVANRWYAIGYAGVVLACLASVALGMLVS
jgi:hypothetical protein